MRRIGFAFNPFPAAAPKPMVDFASRVRAFVEEVMDEPERATEIRDVAAAASRADHIDRDTVARLTSTFARSTEELANLVPDVDEKVAADTTLLTTGTTTATTLTATTFTTLACTTTTTTTIIPRGP